MLIYKEKAYQIYLSFLQTVLTFAFAWWINKYFVLKIPVIVCILYCLAFGIFIYLFDNSKNSAVRFVALLGLPLSLGLLFLIFRTNPFLWAKNIIVWCIEYNRTDEMYEPLPAYTVLAVVSCLAGILLCFFIKKLTGRVVLAASVFTAFIVLGILKINTDKVVVGIGIFYILCSIIELSGVIYSKKSGKEGKKEGILYLLPVCLLLTAISVVLPSRPDPIQWNGVKRLYYTVRDQIDKLVTEWEFLTGDGDGVFSISLSGYSEDGSLDNEDLAENNKTALIIKGRKGNSSLYLTGSVSDTYTGYSWERSEESYLPGEEEYMLDYAELIYSLSRTDPQIIEEDRLLKRASINIFYNNIKTRSFFYPAKSYRYEFLKAVKEPDSQRAGITFPKAMGDKVAYSISYCELNLPEPEFQDMLRASDSFSYEKEKDIDLDRIASLKNKFPVGDSEKFALNRDDFHELFGKRAEIIRKTYTQLPEDLPGRVKELAIKITADKGSDYDKLKAIENYLLQYTYSQTPGKVPEGHDFVDYFLFVNKKGYCTSYATAMAVLARCIGIPTRYVEGFLVDYSDKTDGGFLVRNSDAHAWVEAYFEGVGWIPFEPTPNVHELRYTAWPSKFKESGNDINGHSMRAPQEAPGEQPSEADGKNSEIRGKYGDIFIWVTAALGIILILFGAMICYYLILRHKYRKEFMRADYSSKMYMLFIGILMMLKYEGFIMGKQETLLMFSDKVKDTYRYGNINFGDVAEIYMAYRYGEIPVTKEDFDTVNIFYKGLAEYRKSKTRKIKRFFEDFAFLIRRHGISGFS